jgi:hypothetical protein
VALISYRQHVRRSPLRESGGADDELPKGSEAAARNARRHRYITSGGAAL